MPKKKTDPKKILLLIVGIVVFVFVAQGVFKLAQLTPFLFELLFKKEINLKTANHRVNILLLGIGGDNHEGPNLTDTVIFVSIPPDNKGKIELVSIPRDLWLPDINGKINTAYATGESKRPGGGLILAKAVVRKILNKPIDYAVRINFDGFEKAVDLLGGIDVNVENTFDDFEYPIESKGNDPCGHTEDELKELATASSQLEAFPCRYKHIHFDKGMQRMNGEKSLVFVRSRHAKGKEGSDFARSKRQEKVIAAVKNKVVSLNTLANPAKVISLYSIIKDSIDTDIKDKELDDFIRLFGKMGKSQTESIVIDTGDSDERPGLLSIPPSGEDYNFEWVLIPRMGNGDFSEIHRHVDCEIKGDNCLVPKTAVN